MQLVAYGAQDTYLSGNPQITFWKVVYRRHTNFSMESIEEVFTGNADFGKKVTCTLARNGDLAHKIYIAIGLPAVPVPAPDASNPPVGESAGVYGYWFRWVNFVGHQLVYSIELELGGQRIDKHFGEWLHVWNELTQTAGKQIGYASMVGECPELTTPVRGGVGVTVPARTLWVPLQFSSCRHAGLALPLIALQYHEVKINIEFNPLNTCYWAARDSAAAMTTLTATPGATDTRAVVPTSMTTCSLFVDMVFLDSEERRRFAQVSHELLIEQLQYTGGEGVTSAHNKLKINLNHPVKFIVWTVQAGTNVDGSTPYGPQWFNYTDAADDAYQALGLAGVGGGARTGAVGTVPLPAANASNQLVHLYQNGQNPVDQAYISLNSHERLSVREGRYYNVIQPYQHFENIPSRGINVYSFALRPEEHQPSGSCNFSRIDTASLNFTLTAAAAPAGQNKYNNVNVWAVNYNVLRVMSGMGGLAYSN
jgi:hypothetical protein